MLVAMMTRKDTKFRIEEAKNNVLNPILEKRNPQSNLSQRRVTLEDH